MSSTKVAIAGVTGKLGTLFARYLLSKPQIQVHGICRNPSKLSEALSSNPRLSVHKVESSSDHAALQSAVSGCNIVMCAYLGDNSFMVDAQKTLIDASIAAGVPRYMASDYSLDYRGLNMGDLPPKDPMKVIQQYLEERKERIKAVHILNGAFMEVFFMPGTYNKAKYAINYWGSEDRAWEMTTYEDAAAFASEVALDTSASGFFLFRGDLRSYKEMAGDFNAVYGETPKLQAMGSMDDLYKQMKENLHRDPSNIWSWMPGHYVYYLTNGKVTMPADKLDNSKYPNVQPKTFKHYLEAHDKGHLGM